MGGVTPKKVSMIIPTIRQVDLVEECLSSLKKFTDWPDYQIIVVDDGSDRQIQKRLKGIVARYDGKFLAKPRNTGFAATVNLGARESKGDYLVLVNNDIKFSRSDWLKSMIREAEASQVGVVGARLLYPNGKIQHGGVRYIPSIANFAHVDRDRPGDLPHAKECRDMLAVTGALMLIRREAWNHLNGMSEEFFIAMEDVDFCLRAWKNSWRVRYCGRAEAYHFEGQTRGTTPENKERYWYSKELEGLARFREKWFDTKRHPLFNPEPHHGLTEEATDAGQS